MRWKTPKKQESNPHDQSLLAACRQGDVAAVQACLAQGAKVNACIPEYNNQTQESGWMPLHLACAHLHEQVMTVLLEQGEANPDLLTKANGLTPLSILLQYQCTNRQEEQTVLRMAETLLRYGADPSGCVDIQSAASPLHMAAQQGRLALVQLLIEYGALMIHGQARSWQHPLHSATQQQQQQQDEKKEMNDADPPTTLTPLSVACRAGHVDIMDYLLQTLPPQTLESSVLLQQALQEARIHRNVDCLVALWEYCEDVLWLDQSQGQQSQEQQSSSAGHSKSGMERNSISIDPARHASLVQCFFDIFQESSTQMNDATIDHEDLHASIEELHASFRRHASSHGEANVIHSVHAEENLNEQDAQLVASWWEVLREACRRRSVNLMQSLLQRLPYQDVLFDEIRRHQPAVRAALLQAVDRHDHQTLLHRFCAANSDNNDSAEQQEASMQRTLMWIQRLLLLSREASENDLEEMRLTDLSKAMSNSPHSPDQENMHRSFIASYEDDGMGFGTLELSDHESTTANSNPTGAVIGGGVESKSIADSSLGASLGSSSEAEESSNSSNSAAEEDSSIGPDSGDAASDDLTVERVNGVFDESYRSNNREDQDGSPSLDHSDSDESDDSEDSYSLDETESESEDDGVRSYHSHDGYDQMNASFVAVPSHSGKNLVNIGDKNLQTALHIACARGFIQAIRILLKEETILVNAQDIQGNTPLMVSHHRGVISCLMLDPRIDMNITNLDGLTRLHLAVEEHDMDMLQFLLQKGASPETMDAQGRTLLYLACEEGNTEICGYLLAHGADPNSRTKGQRDTPLHAASQRGHLGVILRLFSAHVDATNVDGRTPLHDACLHGRLGVVEYLVTERGANLNLQDNDGHTPFELACQYGCVSVVYYLIRYHTSNMWNRTPALGNSMVASQHYLRSTTEDDFHCSYSKISTAQNSSRYSKEDPFTFSSSYSTASIDFHSCSFTHSMSSRADDDDDPYSFPLYDSSPFPVIEPFVYRRSLYEDEPIYY